MASTSVSRRITRLKSRELFVKDASERKLKPRKVVTTNKISKINTSTRDKSLLVSKKNASLKNSQISSIRLRPRRNRKNYCEDSKLLQQYISMKQHDSMVMLEELHLEDNKKVPVYKAIEPSEKSMEDKNDVYDFKFDANDTKEKATKKKQKKRNVNMEKNKMTKKTRRKVTAQPKTIGRKVIKSKPDADHSVRIAQSNPLEFAKAAESAKEDNVKKIETSEIKTDIQTLKKSVNNNIDKEIEPPRIDAEIQTVENLMEDTVENTTPRANTNIQEKTILVDTFVEQIEKKNTNKPRIVSIENANNIVITKSSPNNTGDSRPFQPKNIFDNTSLKKRNSTLKDSLTMKTLSPILKTTNALDLGSPWRPPTLMFSQTKHFIQSTPYKNFETNKKNKEINKKSTETNKNVEINKENMEINKENMEMDKENIDMNKENKGRKNKERKKKAVGLRKKHAIQKKLPISENQPPDKVRTAVVSKSIVPAPVRVSLGEIKNLLQRPNDNGDKQANQVHTEVDKSLVEQKNKQLVEIINFSDTFDVLSETEKLSNIENDAPLFMDLEPSHFSKVFTINYLLLYFCACVFFIYSILLIMFIFNFIATSTFIQKKTCCEV